MPLTHNYDDITDLMATLARKLAIGCKIPRFATTALEHASDVGEQVDPNGKHNSSVQIFLVAILSILSIFFSVSLIHFLDLRINI